MALDIERDPVKGAATEERAEHPSGSRFAIMWRVCKIGRASVCVCFQRTLAPHFMIFRRGHGDPSNNLLNVGPAMSDGKEPLYVITLTEVPPFRLPGMIMSHSRRAESW